MEEELQCPVCLQLFDDPVILPCSHNVCFKCAESLTLKNGNINTDASNPYKIEQARYKKVEADKASLASDAVLSDSDSGYSGNSGCLNAGNNERNVPPVVASNVSGLVELFQYQGGEVGKGSNRSSINGVNMPAMPESVKCLTCPICHRTLFLDDRGADGLTKHTLMKSIVDRYAKSNDPKMATTQSVVTSFQTKVKTQQQISSSTKQDTPVLNHTISSDNAHKCQLCDKEPADLAVVKCIQCEVFYCGSCREKCHPSRGPLAKHSLMSLRESVTSPSYFNDPSKPNVYRRNKYPPLPNKPSPKSSLKLASCSQHPIEKTSLHCETCRVSLCVQCQDGGKHKSHNVKAIGALFKLQKSELSGQMSALSNKARQAKDLVMHLRETQEEIEKCSDNLEAKTIAQCNHVIEAVERKRDELILRISREKEMKSKVVREQLQQCTLKLKQTTGLLEYCIEVMKDNDVAAFLQISQSLTERVTCTEKQWSSRSLFPRAKSDFDLELQSSSLALAVDKLDFVQIKVPEKPSIEKQECGSKNNTVTLAWIMPTNTPSVQGYKLEMDNGSNGPFREVYTGTETVCTVDGLHFNSIYRARVRAYNRAGHGPYSDLLHLQTAEVATFQFDATQSHCDVKLSASNNTVTSGSCEDRVVLGNVGFSRGVHYWEYSIDRFDAHPDPSFGVALSDVDKTSMLGKDCRGWAMYVDGERNWLHHDGEHIKRTDIGVTVGSRVGVLLDLPRKSVTFYINGQLQGQPLSLHMQANSNLMQVFYPALSINQNLQVTLHSGLRSPIAIHPAQLYRNRAKSIPDAEPNLKRSPLLTKSASNYDVKTSRGGTPPLPPLRKGSSSGNVSAKSDGDNSSSEPTPGRGFSSFFSRK